MTSWITCKCYPYCTGPGVTLPTAVATIPDYLPKRRFFLTNYKSNTVSGLHRVPVLHWNDLRQVLHTPSADLLPRLSKWLALQWSHSSWDKVKPIYNPQTALSTHYFNLNYRATFLSQAAQVNSSLGPRYIWSCWGLHDNVAATMFKGPDWYTIDMGNSFIHSNHQA